MSEDEPRAAWLDREPYAGLMLADYATETLTQARARGESLDGYRLVVTAEPVLSAVAAVAANLLHDNPQLHDKPDDGPATLVGEPQPDA